MNEVYQLLSRFANSTKALYRGKSSLLLRSDEFYIYHCCVSKT